MLFATATKKLNRFIAPAILKHGLTARFVLSRGNIRDNPYLDYMLLLPLAQTVLSIEIQEIAREERQRQLEYEHRKPSKFDQFVDRAWDRYIEPNTSNTKNADKHTDEEDINTNKTPKNPRLAAFQQYLLPILTPTHEFSDIERYRFNSRFIKWLRSEYLICKYESDIRHAMENYTQLRVTPLLQKNAFKETIRQGLLKKADTSLGEFAPLPSKNILDSAFKMQDWNKSKTPYQEYKHIAEITNQLGGYMEEIPGSNVQIANISADASTKRLTLEEILEVSGCHVSSCNAFNALCEEVGIYEFWTKEYVQGLANYLMKRCEKYRGETVIVDIGAGDGTLVHFLRKYVMESRARSSSGRSGGKTRAARSKSKPRAKSGKSAPIPTIIATDDGSWKIAPKADVEKLDVTNALSKYAPFDEDGKRKHQLIVICSWMPMGVDWTQEMRRAGVDEYILIGECDDGNCGDNWYTFGNHEFKDDIYFDDRDDGEGEEERVMVKEPRAKAPYQIDGFERKDLEELSLLQYSRFDSSVSGSSKTISFRKI